MDAMPAIIASWQREREASHNAAISANVMMMKHRMVPAPYYRDLLSLASTLITEVRYQLRFELAVILAQMACEVVVEQTLTPLLKKDKRKKGKKLKTFNLEGGRSATLDEYTRLTQDKSITTQPFWKPFVKHANRRHQIVHFGGRASKAEAQDSLTVATQFVDHVEQVRQELR